MTWQTRWASQAQRCTSDDLHGNHYKPGAAHYVHGRSRGRRIPRCGCNGSRNPVRAMDMGSGPPVIYCPECGCKLPQITPSLWMSLTGALCTSATRDHLPDPLDLALRRVQQAEEAVGEAELELEEAKEEYDYLKSVRVKR